MRLASIHIYPLKAARAVDLDESRVEPWGLAGDRRWLLIDEDGRFISQREESALARVVVSCGPGRIHVSAEGRTGLVIAEPPPWAEDRWRRVRIGPVPFRVAKPCGRCVVTTTDQATGERGRQPLKMLGRRRRFGSQLVFGQNLIPDAGGVIRVGDPVEILDAA